MGCLEGSGVPVLYIGRTVPKECGQDGVDTRLAKVYDSATTVSAKASHLLRTVLAPDFVAIYVFGTGILH